MNFLKKIKTTIITVVAITVSISASAQNAPSLKKIKDIVIYSDTMFFCAFPSIVKNADGEYYLAFRRAPERKNFKENRTYHADPNSYLVGIRSKDGEKWSKTTELIYAHPFGGSQDPCLLQLSDGSTLCAAYAWSPVKNDFIEKLQKPFLRYKDFVFLGGFLLKSNDCKTWSEPIIPPNISPEKNLDVFGKPLPACNRGAMLEASNGKIYWAVVGHSSDSIINVSLHLLSSSDKGLTWNYCSTIAKDNAINFSETSLYETPKGDIVAFIRTEKNNDYGCIARSKDGGKTFEKWENMGFQGHPFHALRLPDKRVLLTYGYRHKPYGIRAKILNSECSDFKTAKEFILREDGGNSDIGYTWSIMLDDNRVLIAYYYNLEDGNRFIGGTIVTVKN